jgi:2-polyprenyl-3-methyl-5-hydroxy-6-metoxy-1,4-benzoquinol methylase
LAVRNEKQTYDDPSLSERHAAEIARGERFTFGSNWASFLETLDEARIRSAEESLRSMLGVSDLTGRRFLDVGSGSGLFSLAARRLGASVHSFDYDPQSVACTRTLRERFFPNDDAWRVEHGSVLDHEYVASLGRFDVVYSWGVLHHTGEMWTALQHVVDLVAPNGSLFIAIYNDQGAWSERWRRIKRVYCSGAVQRAIVLGAYLGITTARNLVADVVWLRNPLARYREYRQNRGMSHLHDAKDWLGGYPFEVAKPEEIFEFYERRGFRLTKLVTQRGTVGCNEFVFTRASDA